MYFVYHGFVSPDRCDASEGPIFELVRCKNAQEVIDLKKEHEESLGDEACHAQFVVIEGTERQLEPVETVTEYRLA